MRLHLKKKNIKEKIFLHPSNISASRGGLGGREQMGISESDFSHRGEKMMTAQEEKKRAKGQSKVQGRMLRPATPATF